MSNARQLVDIIGNLEKQSENLTSALDMYNEIKKLNDQIDYTSEKYDIVVEDIKKIKVKLLESSEENSTLLNESSQNINRSLEENRVFIQDLKQDIENTTQKLEEVNKMYLKVDDILKNNSKSIEKELNDTCWKINNDLEDVKENIQANIKSMEISFDNILKEIESNNDKITSLKLYFKSNLELQNTELKKYIIEEMQKLQVNVNEQIMDIKRDNEKRIADQRKLLLIIIVLLIINFASNLFIK